MTLFRKRHPPPGSRPGTLMIPEAAPPPVVRLIDYDRERLEEREVAHVEEIAPLLETGSVTWVDVQGIGDERLIRRLGVLFDIHALALEDAVNVPQRPKHESYANRPDPRLGSGLPRVRADRLRDRRLLPDPRGARGVP